MLCLRLFYNIAEKPFKGGSEGRWRRLLLGVLLLSWAIMPLKAQIDADRVLKTGRNALYFEDYVVAINYFNRVIDTRPWLAEPYFFRAIAKLSLEDYIGAERDASACIERNSFIPKAYLVRGIAYQNTGEYDKAIRDYRNGIRLMPNNEALWVNLGQILIYKKEYAAADSAIGNLLLFFPKSTSGQMLSSEVRLAQKDSIGGLKILDEIIARDSAYAPANFRLAAIAYERGQYLQGITYLNRALEARPGDLSFILNRGLMRYQAGDLRGAMADYTYVIEQDPTQAAARFNRAQLRAYVGEGSKAVEDFDAVLKLDPNNYIARFNRAILLNKAGHYRRAIADLNIVVAHYSRFVPAIAIRSEAKRALGDIKGADTDYWHAYRIDRDDQASRNKKKESKQGENRRKEAKETREEQDTGIEKYKLLVAEPLVVEPKAQYESEVRGRVQDYKSAIEPMPACQFGYYEHYNERMVSPVSFSELLTAYNRKNVLPRRLLIVPGEIVLTDEQMKLHERDLAMLKSDNGSLNISTTDKAFREGMDYLTIRDFDQATRAFTQAIRTDSTFVPAYFARAGSEAKRIEAERGRDGDPSDSFAAGQSRRKGEPGASGSPFPNLSPTGRDTHPAYRSIMADLNHVIRLMPDFPYAYYNRAVLYNQLGETAAAIADYNRTIELQPHFSAAYFNRGLLQLSLGKTKEGIADLSRAGELGLHRVYNVIKRFQTQ